MRNYEHGASLQQPVDGFLHQSFTLDVEGGGGFVENQDRWVGQQRPCNGQALSLSTRQTRAPLTEIRVPAFRQLLNERHRIGGASGSVELCLRDLRATERHIGSHRVVEEHRVLTHDSGQRA